MIYGYARVSTKGQERLGNSLADQEEKLRNAGCAKIFRESYTGTKMERPEFTKLLDVLKEGDALVVCKLDRFARTASDGAKTVQMLVDRGVEVNVLNMGKADNSPMGKLMVTVMFAFAEFERDMIVERTTAGKAVAREKDPGWREGRKVLEVPEFPAVYERQQRGEISAREGAEILGISVATWHRRAREVKGA